MTTLAEAAETIDVEKPKPEHMVAGFLFNSSRKNVVLIHKLRPEWQRGLLNGVGGRVEADETVNAAMRREFREETGADVPDWRPFCCLKGSWGTVTFFTASGKYTIGCPEEEIPQWYPVDDLYKLPIIPNLRWLVPMALDRVFGDVASLRRFDGIHGILGIGR